MKRYICLILSCLLLLCFCGCHYSEGGDILEPVEFFYPRTSESFLYGAADGVITAEIREASGRINDLNYLLTMYLRGPQSSGLRSPFPAGCKPEEISLENTTLCVTLSAQFASLENMELTIACASLAKTCFSLTSAEHVRISASSSDQEVSMTLEPDTLLLTDYSAFKAQPATEETQ